MSQSRCFDLLKAILDPSDKWWWTGIGLVTLSAMARTDEGRFWATVYLHLQQGPR
jgi:hypothetical protein